MRSHASLQSITSRAKMFSIVMMLLFLARPSVGQTTSTIEGTVTDKQGLAVSGAEVRVEGSTAAITRSVTSNNYGTYQLPGLPAGVYKLTVTSSGFKTRIFEGLELTLNRTMSFDVKLEVGQVQERVEISSGDFFTDPLT